MTILLDGNSVSDTLGVTYLVSVFDPIIPLYVNRPLQVSVKFLDCPPGFELLEITGVCECSSLLVNQDMWSSVTFFQGR